jgi:hypothetical protein
VALPELVGGVHQLLYVDVLRVFPRRAQHRVSVPVR